MTVYHFIGIKGTGMSALAQVLHDMQYEVQGSDVEKHFFTQKPLEERGIPIYPFSEKNIEAGQTIIVSAAYKDDHEEISKARELGCKVYSYPQFLGEFIGRFTSIAVTGAHGKTTTTGLLSHVLENIYPTSFLIGDGTGKGAQNSKYFVFEACEYRRHFLNYHPDYCIMTNIDFDHPDYYKNIDDVYEAFQQMAMQVKKAIIACGDDPYLQQIQAQVPIVYYGLEEQNDFQGRNIQVTENGITFDVFVRSNFYGSFRINGFGTHNVLNALAVIALCHYEGIPGEALRKYLATFQGVKRRFSETMFGSQVLVDDYAHHPREIEATIEAARQKYPNKEIVAIFQPHTFTRTKAFLQQFAASLRKSDKVYLCDIFGSAREKSGNLTIEDLQKLIDGAAILKENNVSVLKKHENAVLLFMGAGDIQKFLEAYKKAG